MPEFPAAGAVRLLSGLRLTRGALNLATTITIAIPTHNRAATLSATLGSVAALAIPPGAELDCIVVDNGSTDATPAAVEVCAKSARFPVRRVFETRLGSSFARNRAIAESKSEFIFFIDDDALAETSWAARDALRAHGARARRRVLDGPAAMDLLRRRRGSGEACGSSWRCMTAKESKPNPPSARRILPTISALT